MPEEHANFVHFLIGNMDNMSEKNQLFLWEMVYENQLAWQEVSGHCIMADSVHGQHVNQYLRQSNTSLETGTSSS